MDDAAGTPCSTDLSASRRFPDDDLQIRAKERRWYHLRREPRGTGDFMGVTFLFSLSRS
jgi:hypothetical protein